LKRFLFDAQDPATALLQSDDQTLSDSVASDAQRRRCDS